MQCKVRGGPGIGGPEGQNDRESCRDSEEGSASVSAEPPSKGQEPWEGGEDPQRRVRGRPSPGLALPLPFPCSAGFEGPGRTAAVYSPAERRRAPCVPGTAAVQRASAAVPLVPGQVPPGFSVAAGSRGAAVGARGRFLCTLPSQVCSEPRSGSRRCRLVLAAAGRGAPEQGRVAPAPAGFLFAALPG